LQLSPLYLASFSVQPFSPPLPAGILQGTLKNLNFFKLLFFKQTNRGQV